MEAATRTPNGRTRQRILLVDDSRAVQEIGRTVLERAGYEVVLAASGRDGLQELYSAKPDLVILDVIMAEMDGWQTLERIRELTDVPVLMLTARGSELEKVRGLRGGADDYVVKPFGNAELVARVEALLRRSGKTHISEAYEDALVSVRFERHEATAGGRPLGLTPTEFRLLGAFVSNPGQALSKAQLLDLVWGDSFAGSGDQVKVFVGYLRRKFEQAGAEAPIETVRGIGYRYTPPSG